VRQRAQEVAHGLAARRQGRGSDLAEADLFAAAEAAGHDRVVCEVNSDPPNPASAAFHARTALPPGARDAAPTSRKPRPAWKAAEAGLGGSLFLPHDGDRR
jgi:hypothetical protein